MATARSCAICSQPALPGGRLCGPCKAALKRARDATVSEAILPPRRARTRPVRAGSTAVRPILPTEPPVDRPRRAGLLAAVAALGALVATAAWVAHVRGAGGLIAPRYAISDVGPAAEAPTVSDRVPDVVQPRSVPAPVPDERAFGPEVVEPTVRAAPARTLVAVRTPSAAPAELQVAIPPRAEEPVATPPPVPAVPVEALAVPALAVEAPPDRWQRLALSLAACPVDDLLAKAVCQQSLRIEHCTGSWGRVPLCPAPVERDHGN